MPVNSTCVSFAITQPKYSFPSVSPPSVPDCICLPSKRLTASVVLLPVTSVMSVWLVNSSKQVIILIYVVYINERRISLRHGW